MLSTPNTVIRYERARQLLEARKAAEQKKKSYANAAARDAFILKVASQPTGVRESKAEPKRLPPATAVAKDELKAL